MKYVITFFLFSFCGSLAFAEPEGPGFFIEPMLTYEKGTVEVFYPLPVDSSKEDIYGFGTGVRVGLHLWSTVFFAIDGRYAKVDYESSALSDTVNADLYNAGFTMGTQAPAIGMRFWLTYIFSGELTPNEISSVEYKLQTLKGYRVGLGFKVYAASLNLEYQDANYDKAHFTSLGPLNPGTLDNVEGDSKSYILSLSFPFSL